MATITEPALLSGKHQTSVRNTGKTAPKSAPVQYDRSKQLRNEIAVLIVFCAVMLFVFLSRHYSLS